MQASKRHQPIKNFQMGLAAVEAMRARKVKFAMELGCCLCQPAAL